MSLDTAKDIFFNGEYTDAEDAVEVGYQQGRKDAIEEFLKASDFLRDYRIDSGKLIGLSIGTCLDEIAEEMKSLRWEV